MVNKANYVQNLPTIQREVFSRTIRHGRNRNCLKYNCLAHNQATRVTAFAAGVTAAQSTNPTSNL
jgi:hypothetical protein